MAAVDAGPANAFRQRRGIGAGSITGQLKARHSARKRCRDVDAAAGAVLDRSMRCDGFAKRRRRDVR